MNTIANRVGDVGESIDKIGQAVYAIVHLMEEDESRKASESGDDFLDDFSRGCLLNGLKILSMSLWEKGSMLQKLRDQEGRP